MTFASFLSTADFLAACVVVVTMVIPAAHDFLVKAFGFEAGGVHRDAEGQAIHGEVRIGESTIWLHRVTPAHGTNSPRANDMAGAGLVAHVADVDAHCECDRA